MTTVLTDVVVAGLAFVGTTFDDFVSLTAQLLVTDPLRYRRVWWAHALALATVAALATALGAALGAVPIRWLAVLALAPLSFAIYSWRHRRASAPKLRRGAITTFVVTLGLGGDNVAVWVPLLRPHDLTKTSVTLITFIALEFLLLFAARAFTHLPRLVHWADTYSPMVAPFVYGALGVLVLFECHLL